MQRGREILRRVQSRDSSGWQRALADAIRDLPELLRRLQLSQTEVPTALAAAAEFPVLVPESYLRRMRPGDAQDPLLLQVLPATHELAAVEGFVTDAVGDAPSRTAPGLLHKYQGRALLIAHGTCAIHCRYCFRRHFPYASEPQNWDAWQPALQAIREDDSLQEIILSGGDPLILSDRRLQQLLKALAEIPHVRRVRIHSRLPIVLPERITAGLVELLKSTRLQPVFVVHANHPQELVADCAAALSRIHQANILLLNQAVLLRGVNDSVEALQELCERCLELGVLPYYLHQLDRVQGTAHFEVPVETGRLLMQDLRRRLPGYAVPRYVWEAPGAESKLPLE